MSTAPEILNVNFEIYLDDVLIVSPILGMTISSEINKIPKATIELNYRLLRDKKESKSHKLEPASGFDPSPSNEPVNFLPGRKISIKLGYDLELEEAFTGYIVKQSLQTQNDGSIILTVDCRHAANRMTLSKRTRFYHHSANPKGSSKQDIDPIKEEDILNQIVKNDANGLKLDLSDFTDPGIEHENMIQYECSDWDFLIVRSEALGYVVNVEKDKIKLLKPKVDSDPKHELKLGWNILDYEAEYDESLRANAIHFKGWDINTTEDLAASEENLVQEEEVESIQSDIYFNYAGTISDNEAKLFVENEAARQELGMVRALVKTRGTNELKVTRSVRISGFNSVWDREVFISGIRHSVVNGSWYSHIQCGMSKKSHAEEYKISSFTGNTNLLPSTTSLVYGKVEAYKTGTDGIELIEVIIGQSSNSEETKSIYARLATFAAGEKGGAVFRPYPGDEVVVGFVNNDPRLPIILGMLYKEKYPFELDEDKQHEVGFSFDDWKLSINEEEKVMTISSKNGQSLVIDDEEKSIAMSFNDQNTILINKDGIEMNAQKIIMNANQGVEIDGTKIEITAQSNMKVSANASMEVESKGTTIIKGQVTQVN